MDLDVAAIGRLAAALRDRADAIRTEADRLVARTDAVGWLGQAGDALRERVRERATGLRRTAARHDDAADALERHGVAADRAARVVEEVERRARRLVEDTGRWWPGFDPPPSGSPRWLEVEVPRFLAEPDGGAAAAAAPVAGLS